MLGINSVFAMKAHRHPITTYCFLFNILLHFCASLPSSSYLPKTVEQKLEEEEERQALQYFDEVEIRYSGACNKARELAWNYATNMTNETEKAKTNGDNEFFMFQAKIQKEILAKFPHWREFKNETIRRGLKYLLSSGPRTMTWEEVAEMNKLQTSMESVYATATVCRFNDKTKCDLKFDPDLDIIFHSETDPKLLSYYWTAWHDKMSEVVPPEKYQEFVAYQTAMAKRNGYKDMFQKWMEDYDDDSLDFTAHGFRLKMFKMWEEIRPLYEKLHAYARMRLRKTAEYKDIIGKCGFVPITATGNLWGQEWSSMERFTKPFPDVPSTDASQAMWDQNYTVLQVFKTAESFFVNLGLPKMTETFWKKSMLERPSDGRDVQCHPMAYDLCVGKGGEDFRIKQCTGINQNQLVMCHHEMGHVVYFQQFAHLDYVFRDGANPGFHEAIGDAIALAVVTPSHLQCKLGLDLGLDKSICDEDSPTFNKQGRRIVPPRDINFLYLAALSKLSSIPFAISVDAWRWEAFEGKLQAKDFNRRWWEIRLMNQGIEPPSDRMLPNLFDPATIYHITADIEYLRYFISYILQYQFYEAMCIAAGQYNPDDPEGKPLYRCDFSGSKEAGKKLMDMLKLGMSKDWPTALEALTGSRNMSTAPLKHYFEPLMDYFDKELKKEKQPTGWGKNCK